MVSFRGHIPFALKFVILISLMYFFSIVKLFSFRPSTGHFNLHTVQRLMLSKGTKRAIFYHITVILHYCWDKTIARSEDMYRDDLGILTLVIKCFGITNTSVQNFGIRISSVKIVPKCLWKLKVFQQL